MENIGSIRESICTRCQAIIDCCDSLIPILGYSKNKASTLLCKSKTSSLLNIVPFDNERYETLRQQLNSIEQSLTRIVIKYNINTGVIVLSEKAKKSLSKIPCLPSESGPFDMKYLFGQLHTDFWLTYIYEKNDYSPLKELESILRLKFDNIGSLSTFSEKCPAKRGDYVYAVNQDDTCLFRGLVLQCSSCVEQIDNTNEVEVMNVDTATISRINLNRIYKIDEEGCSLHIQSLRCSLNEALGEDDFENLQITTMNVLKNYRLRVTIKDTYQQTLPKKYLVEIEGHNDQYGVSLNFNKLIKQEDKRNRMEKLNFPLSNLNDAHSLNDYCAEVKHSVSLLSPGQSIKGLVTYVESPDYFYVHFIEQMDKQLRCLQDEMQVYYNNVEIDLLPFIKAIINSNVSFCACKWNGIWYRGEISTVHDEATVVSIHLIDYGNRERIPFTLVRPLMKQFTRLSIVAQLCHMADIAPNTYNNNSCWPKEVNECLKSLIIPTVVYNIVVVPSHQTARTINKNSLAVLLVDSRPSFHPPVILGDILISKKLAIERISLTAKGVAGNGGHGCIFYKQKVYRTEMSNLLLPKIGSDIRIQVMHIKSLSSIFVHIINDDLFMNGNPEPFELFASKMNSPARLKKMNELLAIPEIGQLVCVVHDDYWYRAQVIQHMPHGIYKIKVKFVDYGCEKIVTIHAVRDIPAEYLVFPFQAVECSLEGITCRHVDQQSPILALMEKFILHRKLNATVRDCNDGKLFIYLEKDTTIGGSDIVSRINDLCTCSH